MLYNTFSQPAQRRQDDAGDENQRRDRWEAAARPTHEMVARKAYEIWRRHGCPRGTSHQDWLAAEAELRSPH